METANVDDAWEELPNAGEQEVGHETERIFWGEEIPARPHAAGNNSGEEGVTVGGQSPE